MANALKTLFTDIASAIREALPNEPNMSPYSFPDKIREVAGNTIAEQIILEEASLSFWTEGDGLYAWANTTDNITFSPIFDLEVGKKYNVTWDGKTYTCTAFYGTLGELVGVAIGNPALVGGSNTGEPFIICSVTGSDAAFCFTAETSASHTVKITQKTSNGGSSNLVKYVTFMSWDGSEKLYEKPTIVGDDCVDPVAKGLIGAPTRESTDTQNFTYAGCSSTNGGNVESDVLKDITEDKVVYAAFNSSVRYYTVTYLDEDGTVLNTVEATYGANVSDYEPMKEGFTFVRWEPVVDNITSDMATTAVWEVDQGWLVAMGNPTTLPSSYAAIKSMIYSPDNTKLFVADGTGYVHMYNATTTPYTKIKSVQVCSSSYMINGMDISPDGNTLVICFDYSNGTIGSNVYIYTVSDTNLTKKTYLSNAKYPDARRPKSVSFNNDGTRLAIADTMVYIIDTSTTTWTLLKTVSPTTKNTYNLAKYSVDGTKLYYSCSSSSGRRISAFNVSNNYAEIGETCFGTSSTNTIGNYTGDIDVSNDGKYVVFGYKNTSGSQSVTKYDTSTTPYTYKSIATCAAVGNVYDLSISPDGTMVAVASDVAPYIHIYDLETGTKLADPRLAPTATCYSCAFSPDGNSLAVGTYKGDPTMLVYRVYKNKL